MRLKASRLSPTPPLETAAIPRCISQSVDNHAGPGAGVFAAVNYRDLVDQPDSSMLGSSHYYGTGVACEETSPLRTPGR